LKIIPFNIACVGKCLDGTFGDTSVNIFSLIFTLIAYSPMSHDAYKTFSIG